MERYGTVTVAQTIKPKDYHSMTRGNTIDILLPAGATAEQVEAERVRIHDVLVKAVSLSLEQGLQSYGKTLKEVT